MSIFRRFSINFSIIIWLTIIRNLFFIINVTKKMFWFWHVSGTLVHPIVVECLFPVSVTQSVCGLRVTGCRLSRLISHLLSPYLHQDTVILTHQSWSLEANYKTLPYTYHDQYQLRSSIISLQQTIFLQLYYPVCLSIFCILVWSGCTSLPLDSR